MYSLRLSGQSIDNLGNGNEKISSNVNRRGAKFSQRISFFRENCSSQITHGRILLLADESSEAGRNTDEEIVKALQVGVVTVSRIRQRFVEQGLESALNRQVQKNRKSKKLDGEAE